MKYAVFVVFRGQVNQQKRLKAVCDTLEEAKQAAMRLFESSLSDYPVIQEVAPLDAEPGTKTLWYGIHQGADGCWVWAVEFGYGLTFDADGRVFSFDHYQHRPLQLNGLFIEQSTFRDFQYSKNLLWQMGHEVRSVGMEAKGHLKDKNQVPEGPVREMLTKVARLSRFPVEFNPVHSRPPVVLLLGDPDGKGAARVLDAETRAGHLVIPDLPREVTEKMRRMQFPNEREQLLPVMLERLRLCDEVLVFSLTPQVKLCIKEALAMQKTVRFDNPAKILMSPEELTAFMGL